LLGYLSQGGWGGWNMWHSLGTGEVFTELWLRDPKVRVQWEDLGVGGNMILRWALGRQGSMGRTGFDWLRLGSSGGLLLAW